MEIIIGLSIAGAALILTLYEIHATRRHNKLSVTPKLTFYGDEETAEYIFEIRLKNEGIGPAKIIKFEIIIDNETIAGGASPQSWNTFFNKLAIKKPKNYKTAISPNTTLGINGCVKILCFEYMRNENDAIFLADFKKRLPNIKFICEYESMYGTKDIADFDGSCFY